MSLAGIFKKLKATEISIIIYHLKVFSSLTVYALQIMTSSS